MRPPAATGRVDVEVKLWENGAIDVLYGDNPANPGDGRDAAIGIENADGSDALQFSFSDDLLEPERRLSVRVRADRAPCPAR